MLLNAHSYRGNAAVWLIDKADRGLPQKHRIQKLDRLCDRSVKAPAPENIAEAFLQAFEDVRTRVERYRPSQDLLDRAKLIDAVTMVGMIVGYDDAVERRNVCCEQLLAQVRTAID